jgi:hypothetical protein
LGRYSTDDSTRFGTQGNAAVPGIRGVALERLSFVLGGLLTCALGCARHEPAHSPKSEVFALRYVEMDPQALVADDVHPLIAALQIGLLDLFDDSEDRRLLSIDPRRTAGARTAPIARHLLDHAPKVSPGSPLISDDGSAEVERYLEAYESALALGVERADLVEPALRLFGALVVRAREDARRK